MFTGSGLEVTGHPELRNMFDAVTEKDGRCWAQVQRLWLNDVALSNMESIWNRLDTTHPLRSWLKELAPENMLCMFVTLETSQPEMLPVKLAAPRNIANMSVALDVTHPSKSSSKLAIDGFLSEAKT